MSIYLDCNATTPVEPEVQEVILHYMAEEFGNAGSRTHEFGQKAKRAVEEARARVASVLDVAREEVVFTSGATESNNLAILGLLPAGDSLGRRHIVSTAIEHKAVLEPLEECARRGYEVTLVSPTTGGWVDPEQVRAVMRPDTLLVSVMHANNETGILQPISEIAAELKDHPAYFHVDAAQSFGKNSAALANPRIDLVSVSGHKIYGPKGIGALITRRRAYDRPPITPLQFGGGQERGIRPGTLPVPLIAGLGVAAELAQKHADARAQACRAYRMEVLEALAPLSPVYNGDPERSQPHVLNVAFPSIDSEALMVALKDLVSIANGSACTSARYVASHVLTAMGASDELSAGSVRISWSHLTPRADWHEVPSRIARLL